MNEETRSPSLIPNILICYLYNIIHCYSYYYIFYFIFKLFYFILFLFLCHLIIISLLYVIKNHTHNKKCIKCILYTVHCGPVYDFIFLLFRRNQRRPATIVTQLAEENRNTINGSRFNSPGTSSSTGHVIPIKIQFFSRSFFFPRDGPLL